MAPFSNPKPVPAAPPNIAPVTGEPSDIPNAPPATAPEAPPITVDFNILYQAFFGAEPDISAG